MERIGADGTSSPQTWVEREREIVELANKAPGHLTGEDCPLCLNRGYFTRVSDDGYRYNEVCKCMARRRSLARIRRSGLSEALTRYTLERWDEREPWQTKVKELALDYANSPSGWFFLAGRPGTGKTHLCTALAGLLMEQGYELRYVLWRDLSTRAKAVVNDDEEYQRIVGPLKDVKVLYIDDLFKTGKGQQPTTGDVNLAFELLNARYNNGGLLTLLSSELTMEKLLDVDEGTASRIYERSKDHYADLSDRENWRIAHA